ncbi:hypothetical protein BN1051_00862 [Arthrobacter saudimassiliensis]|uniref:DUF559 domain-containing protein n=1 Tax=Arthrobacter saudimassiliensis TaxID=1461584 RepID=A0A078MQ87_9MICC|nr:hypothetical protein BN1051_00862 [Arthrobacter saudimassiliensis]
MRVPEPLPSTLSTPFTVAEARQLGLTPGRLRSGDLRLPSRGIRVPVHRGGSVGAAGEAAARAEQRELAARCRPYLQLLPDAVLSHTTAARLHGLPLPPSYRHEPVLHLTRAPGRGAPRRRHVQGHRQALNDAEVVLLGEGLRVTSPARTWVDLATLLCADDLVAAGDYLVSEYLRSFGVPRRPVIPLAQLRAYVFGLAAVPGIRAARRAAELLRVGVDSAPESRLRLMLHRAGLPEFTPNEPLLDETGHPAVWADLGCREFRTCVEYDGAHHLTRDQQARDNHRDLLVAELGWHQVKVNAADMRLGEAWVAAKVVRGLVLGGWTRPEQ